nr:phosphoribosylglycinamide synthetase C domain-containing protein [Candidatus Krumholzibacteria bacterium]
MGAFAPVPLPAELYEDIDTRIVLPVLAELRRRDIPYRGVLYIGLMLTEHGPSVLEFNCRFGDPETQVVLPLLGVDLMDLCEATAAGRLGEWLQGLPGEAPGEPAGWTGGSVSDWRRHAVVVVGASDGYPGRYIKGRAITLPADTDESWIVHAGTEARDGAVVTAGGRVLGAVGVADTAADARRAAYALLDGVHFEGLTFRRDIAAARAAKHE